MLPVFGNNDVTLHYNLPCDEESSIKFYTELFDIWFPPNSTLMNRELIKDDFLEGGYYRYDIPNSDIAVLSLNTIAFATENECMLEKGYIQLKWLEKQLKSQVNRKFILQMHIFPGLNYYKNSQQVFWKDNFTEAFEKILSEN